MKHQRIIVLFALLIGACSSEAQNTPATKVVPSAALYDPVLYFETKSIFGHHIVVNDAYLPSEFMCSRSYIGRAFR